ncbi:hypothetical protein BDN72DRAFT_866549 [Pluteus cervinus]|uniref:Uncharacterized protein n=1 Tax=Pluteus cervinus TaxID=181527 RepID=A0ACD3BFP3_9AGAR|nr:hypothetical protein BDN72DRAFT_866549 [Pluteus cervinus]
MDAFADVSSLWGISQGASFSQVSDEDFLALLQKQLPQNVLGQSPFHPAQNSIDPQNINRFSFSSLTPSSDDSSPSPPQQGQDQSLDDSGGDPALKRKADDEDDMEEGPSHKHTSASQNKKTASTAGSRRKSAAATSTTKDEGRLLKRKEQNRAAQRAFRERKEKHVKDLEDKVAALEAKNEQAVSENENLRDLLQRLQNENVILKQSPFTFSMPKDAGSSTDKSLSNFHGSDSTSLASSPQQPTTVSSPLSDRTSPRPANPLDWNSLTAFDPAMLNLLDDHPQPTATESASMMDFGIMASPYTTIANNPMFMSLASNFDSATPSDPTAFNFDQPMLSEWPSPSLANQENSSLDEIFAPYFSSQPTYTFSNGSTDSPITHHTLPSSVSNLGHTPESGSGTSSSSSPESSISDAPLNTPIDGVSVNGESHDSKKCPKSRSECVQHIENSGPSPFAPPQPMIRKASDPAGPIVKCQGSSFLPKTEKSDENIEVLAAWRTIMANPKVKEGDINELCTEFTRKARCDGTKVVLEPSTVNSILDTINSRP